MESITLLVAVGLGVFAIVYYVVKRTPVLSSMGLTFNRWLPIDLIVGLLIGIIAIVLVFVVEFFTAAIRVGPGNLTGTSFLNDYVTTLGGAALLEEVIFRVLLLSGVAILLSRLRYGRWVAVAGTAALFGAIHLTNEGATAIGAIGNVLGGVIYGVAFLATRSIWLPLGLHFAWNATQGMLGFPISGNTLSGWLHSPSHGAALLTGGTYGPEGGIPGMLVRILIITLVLIYVKRRWPAGSIATLQFAPDPQRRQRGRAQGADPVAVSGKST